MISPVSALAVLLEDEDRAEGEQAERAPGIMIMLRRRRPTRSTIERPTIIITR